MKSNMDLCLSRGRGSVMRVVSAGTSGAGGIGLWNGVSCLIFLSPGDGCFAQDVTEIFGSSVPAHYFVLVQAFCCLVPPQDVPVPVDDFL